MRGGESFDAVKEDLLRQVACSQWNAEGNKRSSESVEYPLSLLVERVVLGQKKGQDHHPRDLPFRWERLPNVA